ncbi:SPOR domain-containing protein [Emcibacter sp.]|uniref:SPOR domain-containing protein n=1 Tax=Emcibacter sp. TaxID=1979954 RepID=UPI002AA64828|nr:SPOR domain-containing protein [Emcibacter sp.]
MKNTILILPFLLAAQINPSITVASATVSDGVRAYEAGNYEQAREEWLPYAALGNPNALYNLGQLYRMGRGVRQDFKKAEEYYLRAAEKGHVGAQRNLGTLYYFGRLGTIDMEQAYKWLYRAASNGDARSQYIVGTMYYNGQHVAQNKTDAYAWIHLSAQQGIRDAMAAQDKLKTYLDSDTVQAALARAPGLVGSYRASDDRDLMVDSQNGEATEETTPLDLPDEGRAATPVTVSEELPATSKQTPSLPETTTPDISAPDNYRVQVGSFRSSDEADTALSRLKQKHAGLIDSYEAVVQVVDIKNKGIFYRLQLRPFADREAANLLCDRIKDNGGNCYSLKTPPQP